MNNEQARHALGGTEIPIDRVLYWTKWPEGDPLPTVDCVSCDVSLKLPASGFARLQSRGLAGVTDGKFWCYVKDVP